MGPIVILGIVERRGRANGVYNSIKGAGYVVSPIVGGAILLQGDFSMIFVAAAAIGTFAFFVSLFLSAPKGEPAGLDDDGLALSGLWTVLRQSTLWPWYLVTVVNMFFVGILFGFLPVRVYALGYGPLINGILLTGVTASHLLIQPIAGALADRVNPLLTIRGGLFLAGAAVLLVPFVTGALLLLIGILAGLGVGTVWTNTDAVISQEARAGRMGATMGVAGTFKELGDMLGPFTIGLLSQGFGLTVGFAVCGVLGLLSLALISHRQGEGHPSA